MSALSELRCASCYLAPNRSGTAPSKPAESDIEPSLADVVEEPDDPIALARSMQGKRHRGPK
ncbi:MAG TPA: hypothetical protein VH062_35745 [Polyangiaceae bacterium]|jgi:hypothetical protein|nr:hypothetical protein [Polyangiaceae bacterium]